MQLEHASSSFYSPQERALVRNTTASAILDQVQSLATFEAFGTHFWTFVQKTRSQFSSQDFLAQ